MTSYHKCDKIASRKYAKLKNNLAYNRKRKEDEEMGKAYDPTKPFQNIADASRTTGISQFALRQGCRNNTLPHIRCGKSYLLNMRLLQQYLDEQSVAAIKAKA